MGWNDNPFGNPFGAPPQPPSPFGFTPPAPPDPFGGGMPNPFGGPPTPGAWPSGVPNPFGLPSPGDMFNTVSNWFSNPYGTHGTQYDPGSSMINPYGNQVSGGNTNPWKPPDPWITTPYNKNPFQQSGGTFSGNMGGPVPGMAPRTPTPAYGDLPAIGMQPARTTARVPLKPAGWVGTPQPTMDRWGGGFGTGGPWGQRHQQASPTMGTPNWHDVPLWGGSKT